MKVVFLTGLIDPVPALSSRFRCWSPGRGRCLQLLLLFLKNVFVFLNIRGMHVFTTPRPPREGSGKPPILAPRSELIKDKVLHGYDVVFQEFTVGYRLDP